MTRKKLRINLYFFLIIIFFFIFHFLITTTEAFDFNANHYMYISWRLAKGDIPYRDFLVPHPPLLFLVGAVLIKLIDSIYFIQFFIWFVFILSGFLFYRLILKLYKNKTTALISVLIYFIFPQSIDVWKGFSPEIFLRLFVLLIIELLLPLNNLTKTKVVMLIILSYLSIMTKFSILPFLIIVLLFIAVKDKKLSLFYSFFLILMIVISIFLLQKFSHGNFLFDTVYIRRYLPLKEHFKLIQSINYFFNNYSLLIIVNLIYLVTFFLNKNKNFLFISLSSLIIYPFLRIIIYDGTYAYVYYPYEPILFFIPLGILTSLITGDKKQLLLLNQPSKKYYLSLILVIISISFILQSFVVAIPIRMRQKKIYQESATKIYGYINKYSKANDEVLISTFINNYLSQRKHVDNFSESFLWRYSFNGGNIIAKQTVSAVSQKIESKKIPIIILDENLNEIKPIYDSTANNYLKIDQILGHGLNIYIPMKKIITNSILPDHRLIGVGFSAQQNGQRLIKQENEFYGYRAEQNYLSINMRLNEDIIYPQQITMICNNRQVYKQSVNKGNVFFIKTAIDKFRPGIIKCSLEIKPLGKNLDNGDSYLGKVSRLELSQ